MDDPVLETKKKLRRIRMRRRLKQSILDGKEVNPHHDLLVVPPRDVIAEDELFRVPVVKVEGVVNQGEIDEGDAPKGTYVDPPERLDRYDYALRRTLSIARPQDWGRPDQRNVTRGPAFGTLPVKREPAATASAACYLINAQNLTFRNAWTAEEWTGLGLVNLDCAPSADDDRFEVLLAGPRGKVFHLKLRVADVPWKLEERVPIATADNGKSTQLGEIRWIDLRHEVEIWNQLRNGLVAGRVLLREAKDNQPTPLVNITTLVPDEPSVAEGARP